MVHTGNYATKMDKRMVVDVIDIRKRIEKIRNEVSEAIVSRHEFEAHEEALREDINLSVSSSEAQRQANDAAQLPLLENPIIDYKIFNNLAYGQWTLKEIETGEAWENILNNTSF